MTKSIYDQLNAYGTVAKQRFVENFSGDALDIDRWNTFGSGTATMQDSVDGGLLLTSPTNGAEGIDFSPSDATKKRPFSQSGSVMIAVTQMTQAQYSVHYGNLRSNHNSEAGTRAGWTTVGQTNGNSGDNKIRLVSSGTATIDVDTTIASANIHDLHVYKLELSSGTASLSIDGALSGTGFASGSSNPTSQLMPCLISATAEGTISGGAKTKVTYCEAYNT